jgi:predicted methyltransferase
VLKITELVHRQAAAVVAAGDTVVDATAGGGRDTLFMAGLVGSTGRVFAFDIQPEALARTESLLRESGLIDRVTLLLAGHEQMAAFVSVPVAAVIFNLGYLPGGDKNIVTRPETTLEALQQALALLRPGGVVMLVAYPGHEAGAIECKALYDYCRQLDAGRYSVSHLKLLNQDGNPPELFSIYRQ